MTKTLHVAKRDTKWSAATLMHGCSHQITHAERLLAEDQHQKTLECIDRIQTYAKAARELVLELAEAQPETAVIRLTPDGRDGFKAAILENGSFRVFASGPYPSIISALHAVGLSSGELERRFIVPTPNPNITHYLTLSRVDAA